MIAAGKGKILISEPFLEDPHFHRSAIWLLEHSENGSLGLVLNHATELVCEELFEDFNCQELVYLGGPVGRDQLLYLHNMPDLDGSVEVVSGIYRGGDFKAIKFMYQENLIGDSKFRYFVGYSGWGPGQLEEEIVAKSWIVCEGKVEYVFNKDPDLWKRILREQDREFAWLSNAPDDVNLN